MVSNKTSYVKPRVKFSEQEIPDLWAGYLATESLAPSGLRAGIARARTALLSAVPSWDLPRYLDTLAEGRPA